MSAATKRLLYGLAAVLLVAGALAYNGFRSYRSDNLGDARARKVTALTGNLHALKVQSDVIIDAQIAGNVETKNIALEMEGLRRDVAAMRRVIARFETDTMRVLVTHRMPVRRVEPTVDTAMQYKRWMPEVHRVLNGGTPGRPR